MFKISRKKKKDLCVAYRCKCKRANKQIFCSKHKARKQKEVNPEGYFFNLLKQNAKRRGKEFQLTREEFHQFCEETNYLNLKGKTGESASIDRIDPNKGYEAGNIRILSLSDNSKKGCSCNDPF